MIKNPIRVYARIKKEKNDERLGQYEIVTRKKYDNLILNCPPSNEITNKSHKFRFNKVFDMESSQVSLFETIARPVVSSVIDGFNGTIFAYGQTGSGKTFTITGSSQEYNERGIIPRSIEAILDIVEKSPRKYTVYISYLEIYNEVGYDLLTAKHQSVPQVEELPRVVLLEDGKGEAHLRNLTILPVTNVQEAMRLLFLGDTNRIIVETPMNDCSSRSHCIFTIYIYNRREHTANIRKSKLHLVDLAGSERVFKSNITGQTLTEAKYINLSLHYLERVITALSQARRTHIPYRNSMMTYMLRDSLGGNCLTAMIATLAMTHRSMEETLSTCRFAQRVALIHTEPVINEETDSNQELVQLRKENDKLKKQLQLLTGFSMVNMVKVKDSVKTHQPRRILVSNLEDPVLTNREIEFCHSAVEQFLNEKSDDLAVDLRQPALVRYCFALLKQSIIKEKEEKFILHNMCIFDPEKEAKHSGTNSEMADVESNSETPDLAIKDKFSAFMCEPDNMKDINYFKSALQQNYNDAANLAERIDNIKSRILETKNELEKNTSNSKIKYKLNMSLMHLQNSYKNTLSEMQEIKNKTDHLKCGLEQSQIKLLKKYYKQNCQGLDYEHKIDQFNELLNGKLRSNLFQDSYSDEQLKPSNDSPETSNDSSEHSRNLNRKKSSSDTNIYMKPSDKAVAYELKMERSKLYSILNKLKFPDILNKPKTDETPIVDKLKLPNTPKKSKTDETPIINASKDTTKNTFKKDENRPLLSKIKKSKYEESVKLPDSSKEVFIKQSILTDSNFKSDTLKRFHTTNNNNVTSTSSDEKDDSRHEILMETDSLPSSREKTENEEFVKYMKTIQLTGDNEVDDEIYHFYKSVFKNK